MAQKIIAANWKENPKTASAALRLFEGTARAAAKVSALGKGNFMAVICPPSIFLEGITRAATVSKNHFENLALGAQDVFWEEQGPFTGGVGPKMLRVLGVSYVIIGHSERRKWFNETDAMINKKIMRAIANGLHVILCVGEPLAVREKGIAAAKRYLKNQLVEGLKKVFEGSAKSIIVAYEPIWAIGSGNNDEPKDAAEIALFIKETVGALALYTAAKKEVKVKVLYGGSVNSKNVGDYVQLDEIDGALVGGASLKADEFGKLMMVAAQAGSKSLRSIKK
jgi:triosephosphate isomerase